MQKNTTKNILKKFTGRIFKNYLKLSSKKFQIIFMYHRITDELPKKVHDPNMYVRSKTFDMHLEEIKKYFQITALEKIFSLEKSNKRLCYLTFDDGWIDNLENALPILMKHSAPATVFIPVDDIGTSIQFWFEKLFHLANLLQTKSEQDVFIEHFNSKVPKWNPDNLSIETMLQLQKELKKKEATVLNNIIDSAYRKFNLSPSSEKILMDWNQVNKMGQNGIAFGSHGLKHDILTELSSRLKKTIVFDSLKILKEKCISAIPVFSYPNGNWDFETISYLKEAGYSGAVTTKSGHIDYSDHFLLNRIGISERAACTADMLWFQIFKALNSTKINRFADE